MALTYYLLRPVRIHLVLLGVGEHRLGIYEEVSYASTPYPWLTSQIVVRNRDIQGNYIRYGNFRRCRGEDSAIG